METRYCITEVLILKELFFSCREGHVEILEYLIDYDPDLWDTKSSNGRSPLHTAGRNTTFLFLNKKSC